MSPAAARRGHLSLVGDVGHLRSRIAMAKSLLAHRHWCPECRKTARLVALALEGASIQQLQEEQERLGISPQHEGP